MNTLGSLSIVKPPSAVSSTFSLNPVDHSRCGTPVPVGGLSCLSLPAQRRGLTLQNPMCFSSAIPHRLLANLITFTLVFPSIHDGSLFYSFFSLIAFSANLSK